MPQGHLLQCAEIPAGEPEINAVTELSIGSDEPYDVPNARLTGGR